MGKGLFFSFPHFRMSGGPERDVGGGGDGGLALVSLGASASMRSSSAHQVQQLGIARNKDLLWSLK